MAVVDAVLLGAVGSEEVDAAFRIVGAHRGVLRIPGQRDAPGAAFEEREVLFATAGRDVPKVHLRPSSGRGGGRPTRRDGWARQPRHPLAVRGRGRLPYVGAAAYQAAGAG